ncbi:AGE family epimerase/isomerase [uncultured Algibacter sp.]|uniref:AGE family epimerase/isomerase n=1 Tax=uncultured Algibacter sp. TaxID=298659 RepID=UPI00261F045E|nr:AGE family epimerase/isomerase [uncultured Algibacter sp.]
MKSAYQNLKQELHTELLRILYYWKTNTIDNEHGGFVGKRDYQNKLVPKASKGIILNSRILWSFAAASNHLKTDDYQAICERSFQYLKTYFKDTTHKGVYWELDYLGQPINKRKQVYAQSFTIYALSEYYIYSKNEDAKQWAIELFEYVERYAKDIEKGGYLEAFNEDWSAIDDMRLSDKDMNAAKTMNTHLHILEAYTTLLKIYDNDTLRNSLKDLVEVMNEKFLNQHNHYELFFDEDWNLLSNSVSYGHDIESAWLVLEAAEVIGDEALLNTSKDIAIRVSDTFLKKGIDTDGSVINETNLTTNHTDTDRHWWPQMEALVGLKFAHDIESKEAYISASLGIWKYTKNNLLDFEHGEWHFRVDNKGAVYTQEDKVSMWKAPYHTSRACIKMNE